MFTLAFKMVSVVALALLIMATSACSPVTGSVRETTPVGLPEVRKVSRENYMTGRKFCSFYSSVTASERGKRVTVPRDYSDYSKGSIEIYAYTRTTFNPSLPSYIFVDGGPGQNTHGLPDATDGKFNEIRFDQRGLGCSAPESYDTYKDPTLYSTENTVLDMDQIRKAYGIQTWSIYGVSYGTVPATQYGSKFSNHTTSIVLEGVVGKPDLLHRWSYKSSKINHILQGLSLVDRQAFTQLMNEKSEDTALVLSFLFGGYFYQDLGLRELRGLMPYIVSYGQIQREILKQARENSKKNQKESLNKPPQQPGGIDENVMGIIYCRELQYREKGKTTLNYSHDVGFFEDSANSSANSEACETLGVRATDERPYKIENFPIQNNVYYFQGSHDGATLALGARQHWKAVPQGKSFFMLAQKGGHNPNLTRLFDSGNFSLQTKQKQLFIQALSGLEISVSDIDSANLYAKPSQSWRLWTSPGAAEADFEQELDGIRRVVGF